MLKKLLLSTLIAAQLCTGYAMTQEPQQAPTTTVTTASTTQTADAATKTLEEKYPNEGWFLSTNKPLKIAAAELFIIVFIEFMFKQYGTQQV